VNPTGPRFISVAIYSGEGSGRQRGPHRQGARPARERREATDLAAGIYYVWRLLIDAALGKEWRVRHAVERGNRFVQKPADPGRPARPRGRARDAGGDRAAEVLKGGGRAVEGTGVGTIRGKRADFAGGKVCP